MMIKLKTWRGEVTDDESESTESFDGIVQRTLHCIIFVEYRMSFGFMSRAERSRLYHRLASERLELRQRRSLF